MQFDEKRKKIWTSKKADTLFSLWVRARDGRCMRCGKTENLQNSHFWHRGHSAGRYDPDNCIALCSGCHLYHWEVEKQGDYRTFMVEWLGKERYKMLEYKIRHGQQRQDAIKEFMEWYSSKK